MPLLASILPKVVPSAMLLVLIGLNLGVLLFMSATGREEIWRGPPMPGKRFLLPDPAQAKEVPPPAEQPPEKKEAKAVEAKPKPVVASSSGKTGFIVQSTGFLDLGTTVLMEQLRKAGMEPWVETAQEMVRLNDVQAGPYNSQKDAKEAEAQLKAAGIASKVEETWEGFILSLSRSAILGEALQELEKAKGLGLSAVRLAKVEEERSVRRVCLGPFPTKEKAKEVSARVAKLGLTIPTIKEWIAPAGKSK
ncbi:MAG: SPOR domain-containing protein [Magnetococcus sp. YQC-3]